MHNTPLVFFAVVALLAGVAYAQSGDPMEPFFDLPCENTFLGRGGRGPRDGGLYRSSLFESTTTPKYTMIMSLCNKTSKWPRDTNRCDPTSYFLGLWDSNGNCVGSYDQSSDLALSLTDTRFTFTNSKDNRQAVVDFRCDSSTTSNHNVELQRVDVSNNNQVMIDLKGDTICPDGVTLGPAGVPVIVTTGAEARYSMITVTVVLAILAFFH